MEKAQAQLESLKEQRSQQIKVTESIVRQRDMYRVLLAQATGVSFPQQGNQQVTYENIPHMHILQQFELIEKKLFVLGGS